MWPFFWWSVIFDDNFLQSISTSNSHAVENINFGSASVFTELLFTMSNLSLLFAVCRADIATTGFLEKFRYYIILLYLYI